MPLHVEIDVYSGRPNPSFELTGSEAAEMSALLHNLPRAQSVAPESGLGYRGFVVSGETGLAPDLPARVRVFRGYILTEKESGIAYHDVHDAEGWLKIRARRAGHGDLFD
jgi:hypothetical protein